MKKLTRKSREDCNLAISNVLASINKAKEGFDMGFLSSDIVELDDNDENETEDQNKLQNEVNDVMSSNPLKNTIVPPDVKTEDDTSKTLVRFTQKEDEYLMLGIKKHGSRNWADILSDKNYSFHPYRSRDALRVRAGSRAFKSKLEMKNS